MSYKINFQKAKRNFITLTFDDEGENGEQIEKVICVSMPKKRILTALLDMQAIINRKEEAQTEKEKTEMDQRIIDEMYDLTAQILSCNLKGEKITTEWVEDQMNVSELKEFYNTYVKFVNGETASPN